MSKYFSLCLKGAKTKTDSDIENQYEQVPTDANIGDGVDVEAATIGPSYFQKTCTSLSVALGIAYECVTMCYHITFKENVMMSVIGLFVPIITTLVGTHKNKLFNDFKDGDDIATLVTMFVMYEIMSSMVQGYFMWRQSGTILMKARLALEVAKIKCAVKIPGANLAECNDLSEHIYKIRDFAVVPGMIWTTSISFLITIYGIESSGSKFVIAVSSLVTLVLLVCINDSSLYERDKYNHTKITDLGNTDLVHVRHSYGASIDYDHYFKRMAMQERQSNIQKLVVCALNFVIIWVTLSAGTKQYVLNFMSITWLISCLADNIKGLQYYSFVKEYMNICEYLIQHDYQWSQRPVDKINITSVRLDAVSYGYMSNLKDSITDIKIKDLSYTFDIGKIYYIEAPNGVGKSTLLRTFTHNVTSGNIFFGDVDRNNMSWEQLHSAVFHLVQASEFCPRFRKEDIDARKDSDLHLAKGLCISELFGKSSDEMSGGEKQRMNLYLALTSNAPVILLDEILSEISVIPSDDHPNGLRNVVIDTILGWSNRSVKLIIIVGHGVFDSYTGSDVVKLKICTSDVTTKLVPLK